MRLPALRRWTFVSLIAVCLIGGGLGGALLLRQIEQTFVELQAHINAQQAARMAGILAADLAREMSPGEVTRHVQVSLESSLPTDLVLLQARVQQLRNIILQAAIALLFCCVVGGTGAAWCIGRRYERRIEATNATLERRLAERTADLLRVNTQLQAEVTVRQHADATLRQAQKMEAIGTLAGGMAHGFNNILSVIMGFTELALLDIPPGTSVQNSLREVLAAGKRAKELVAQILTFSRHTEQAPQVIQLQSIIQDVLELLRASLPSTIDIRQRLTLVPGTILANPTHMHQVLMHLCTNAGHAMWTSGGVLEICLDAVDIDTQSATQHPGLQPGLHFRLTIQDSGHGMTPQVMERIFEPFFTTKAPGEGTGMGLAMVHGIVVSHGGIITVDSTPGQGTHFAVYLPRHNAATPATEAGERAAPGWHTERSAPACLPACSGYTDVLAVSESTC
jgi:signal transduction histidine kinase